MATNDVGVLRVTRAELIAADEECVAAAWMPPWDCEEVRWRRPLDALQHAPATLVPRWLRAVYVNAVRDHFNVGHSGAIAVEVLG